MPSSENLLWVNLRIRAPQECHDVDNLNFDFETEICAGGNDYQDTCQGDSGGGLYARDIKNGRYYLVGRFTFF